MTAAWQTKTLGDACQIARGGSPRPIQDFMTNDPDGVNWVKISDATASGKFIYVTKEKIKPSGVARSRFVKPGDFLLSNSMSFGRPYIMQTTGCIHDGWLVLSDYEKCFDQGFLYHLLGSPVVFEQFDRLAAGSTVRNLNIELASRVVLPVPPLPEQQRIVTLLDEAFEGIATAKAHAEKNLKNARAIFDGFLRAVFAVRGPGWAEKTLKQVSREFGRGKSKHRPRGDTSILGGQYPLIQTGDVANSDHLIVEYSQTYNEAGLAQSKLWPKGTVCIAIVGANVAETAILDFDSCFPDSVIGIVVNDELADNEYVEFLLQTFKAILKERGKGTARDNINLGTFESQKFPFPEVAEQKRIVVRINELALETQRLEAIYEQKLTALDELKKSLLHRAFNGDL